MSAGRLHKNPIFDHRLGGTDSEWVLEGICRTHDDPDIWWPSKPHDAWLGVALCHTCPVMQQCLDWAVTHCEHSGTWGGTDQWTRAYLMNGKPTRRRRASTV